MNPLFWLFALAGTALQIVLLSVLVRDRYWRSLPFVFVYSVALLVTNGVDWYFRITLPKVSGAGAGGLSNEYFWLNDCLRQFCLFLVVMSLLYRAVGHSNKGKQLRHAITIAFALVAVVSAFVVHDSHTSQWPTLVIRNVSFTVVFVNLIVWSALIRTGDPERLPLMLTAGVGLQMTGEAIGQALRSSPMRHGHYFVVVIGNVILVLAHILCLVTWLYALKADQRRVAASARRTLDDGAAFPLVSNPIV
ncbi:MAG: hypothetical protein ABI165_00630 [Bryobacteraceae bacterium]